MVRYRTLTFDSRRWDGFSFRDGDIVVSTPPKSGTTWVQMICTLLVFATPDFPGELDRVSPWLDTLTRSRESVWADLEAQKHRRVIKTHTPVDGLPADDRVTYVCVGRDPRDVGISYGNHIANFDTLAFLRARKAAVGLGDVEESLMGSPTDSGAEVDRFRQWMLDETPVTANGFTLRFTLHHLRTFWEVRDSANVILLHYDDLQADLAGEMHRLAERLNIAVPDAVWPSLVRAATFEDMRAHAGRLVPESGSAIWREDRRFFHRGASGQWTRVMGEDDLRDYAVRVAALAPPDLVDWVHREPITLP